MKDTKPTRAEISHMRRYENETLAKKLAEDRKDRAFFIARDFMIENAESLKEIRSYKDQLRLIDDLQARILAVLDGDL